MAGFGSSTKRAHIIPRGPGHKHWWWLPCAFGRRTNRRVCDVREQVAPGSADGFQSPQVAQHDIQVTEQFMIEISNLQPEHNVFLVVTTNHPDHVDPRVLRGGRFSEKIEIGLPGRARRERLLHKCLDGVAIAPDAGIPALADRLRNLSPTDLEAISNTARRLAFNRARDDSELPPLIWADFEKAVQRVRRPVLQH